jgi:ankyrin repeat protein
VREYRRGNTPLHIAAANGHLGMVSLLIKQERRRHPDEPSTLDMLNEAGNTPLRLAALHMNDDVTEMLHGLYP